jgi:hypothetical protein
MATIKELGDGGPDGSRLGKVATELVGFYGATPVDQPAATAQSSIDNTVALTTITNIVTTASLTGAFNSVVARVDATATLVNRLRTDLIELGLIKGSI